jgi:uncharacterized membrane protein
LVNILSAILVLTIIFAPIDIIRIILGIPFILFFPGYALMIALYPRKTGWDRVTLIALSMVLSLAIVALIGLVLNYTSFGIRLDSILFSTFAFIVVLSVIGYLRIRQLRPNERRDFKLTLSSPHLGTSGFERGLSIVLIIFAMGALGMAVYDVTAPKTGQKFTEFFVLGSNDQADSYPKILRVGESGQVLVGIINHEYATATYRLEVQVDGTTNNVVEDITLPQGGKWENEVIFTPEKQESSCEVEFFLYKNDETSPLLDPLRLFVQVIS